MSYHTFIEYGFNGTSYTRRIATMNSVANFIAEYKLLQAKGAI